MMDSGPVRNMQSTLSNKSEKLCILLVFTIRTFISVFVVRVPTSVRNNDWEWYGQQHKLC